MLSRKAKKRRRTIRHIERLLLIGAGIALTCLCSLILGVLL